MSKPNSGLFVGTVGAIASEKSSAESIIARRTSGMDLREHPIGNKQLNSKKNATTFKKDRNSYGYA